MTLHVICTAYKRTTTLGLLISSFLIQTDPRWILYIIYDGPVPEDVQRVINFYKTDQRIRFSNTPTLNGQWGHPNRAMMLNSLGGACDDYVLITNDDNYYVPTFVEGFLKQVRPDIGMVYCNTLHSYMKYNILYTRIKENLIDMGSFIVKQSVAKSVGFKHRHLSADGRYAEECAEKCRAQRLRVLYIDRCLFIHN